MRVQTVGVLMFASMLGWLATGTDASARDRCDARNRDCRTLRFYESPLQSREGARYQGDSVRRRGLERAYGTRAGGRNTGQPSSSQPCRTRPIVSGERTRAVPTC